MISIQRSGLPTIEIDFILLDFEGTVASDRRVHPKVKDKINLLSKRAKIYILARGEKEAVEDMLRNVKAETVYFKEGRVSQEKLDFIRRLGTERTIAVGNGADDALMIAEAGIGICVISKEGTSTEMLRHAKVVFSNILDALDFMLKPLRQTTTLGL
jgi:soluble P-type ATPase